MNKNAADEYEGLHESSADNFKYIANEDDPSNKLEMRVSASEEMRILADNEQNLFDDSDYIDKRWLKLAKKHLSKWKSRR